MTNDLYKKLEQGYVRSIVGFDLRVRPSVNQKTDTLLGTWLHRPAVRATLEELVWQKRFDEVFYEGRTNGMNLFDDPPNNTEILLSQEDIVLAAFDMPDVFALPLSQSMFGIELRPFSFLERNPFCSFIFCGYDIICTSPPWHSYFYSHDVQTEEILDMQSRCSFGINEWGLVSNEATAIRISECFTKEGEEKRYQQGCERRDDVFAPCGVWISMPHDKKPE